MSSIDDLWDDSDYCYECMGYGDDYNEETGESNCDDCPYNPNAGDWDDD